MDSHGYAKSIEALPSGKEPLYVRDVWWPNVRKMSKEKRDNARKTGTGGGSNAKTNDVDVLVFDILGKQSPALEGLGVPESMDELAEEAFHEAENQPCTSKAVNANKSSNTTTGDSSKQSAPRKIDKSMYNKETSEHADLICLKLQLTIEILENERELKSLEIEKMRKESHYMNLKIFDFELKHGLPRSEFPENLGNVENADGDPEQPMQEEYLLPSDNLSDEEFGDNAII